jgi:hypothetical protein
MVCKQASRVALLAEHLFSQHEFKVPKQKQKKESFVRQVLEIDFLKTWNLLEIYLKASFNH